MTDEQIKKLREIRMNLVQRCGNGGAKPSSIELEFALWVDEVLFDQKIPVHEVVFDLSSLLMVCKTNIGEYNLSNVTKMKEKSNISFENCFPAMMTSKTITIRCIGEVNDFNCYTLLHLLFQEWRKNRLERKTSLEKSVVDLQNHLLNTKRELAEYDTNLSILQVYLKKANKEG